MSDAVGVVGITMATIMNSMFKTDLDIRFSLDCKSGRLLSDLIYHHHTYGEIIVPAGFTTDFASVPWFFSRIVPRVYGTASPAVVHDYLYSTNGDTCLTREQCDHIFADALRDINFHESRVTAALMGVRLGGGRAWKRYEQQ